MQSIRSIVGLVAAAALAAGGLTAAGPAGAAQASNTTIWNVDRTPVPRVSSDPDATLTLRATTAVSPTDAWAVGSKAFVDTSRGYTLTLAEHWDGVKWSIVPTPAAAPRTSTDTFVFSAIDAIASNDVWAVVRRADDFGTPKAVFSEHWDGTRWTIVPFPALNPNFEPYADGITAIAANDVWVAGTYRVPTDGCFSQLLEHWDGVRWTQMPGPLVTSNSCLLSPSAISGSSPTDIWITGQDLASTVGDADGQAFAEHYDGRGWTQFGVPDPANNGNQLTGLTVLSPTNAWAVGAYYNAPSAFDRRTLIEHWNGTAWKVVPSPNVNPETYINDLLFSVTALSATDLWAVGRSDNRRNGLGMPLTEHWNGTSWSVVASPNPDGQSGLFGVSSAAPGNVFAIGAYSPGPPGTVHTPAVLHTTRG